MTGFLYRLLFLPVIMLINGGAFAEIGAPAIVLTGVVEGLNGGVRLVKELDIGDSLPGGEYRVRSNVDIKTRGRVYLKYEIEAQSVEPNGEDEIDIRDFDELWVDYHLPISSNFIDPGIVGSTVDYIRKGEQISNQAVMIEVKPLIKTRQVDLESAVWVPKDRKYSLWRLLDFEFDSDWRYTKEKERVILQRRFSNDLTGVAELNLVLEGGIIDPRIQRGSAQLEHINLRLSTEDDANVVVAWGAIPKWFETDNFGRTIAHLQIGQMLATEFPGQEGVVLKEIVIFLRGEVEEIMDVRPIKQLNWIEWEKLHEMQKDHKIINLSGITLEDVVPNVSFESEENLQQIALPYKTVLLDDRKKRIAIYLRNIVTQFSEANYSELEELPKIYVVKIYPSRIEFEDIQLIKRIEKQNQVIEFLGPPQLGGLRRIEKQNQVIEFLGTTQLEGWGVRLGEVVDANVFISNDIKAKYKNADGWIDIGLPVGAKLQKGIRVDLGITNSKERVKLQPSGGRLKLVDLVVDKTAVMNDGISRYVADDIWLKVDSVLLERKKPFTLDEWIRIAQGNQPGEAKSGTLLREKFLGLAFCLATLIVFLWLSVQRGWLQKVWKGVVITSKWIWGAPLALLKFLYGITPQLDQVISFLSSWRGSMCIWLVIAGFLYARGIWVHWAEHGVGENYWFTFGGLAALMVWRSVISLAWPRLEEYWPAAAKKMHGKSGMPYFSGFVLVLVVIAVMIILEVERAAEQVAVVGYYMLVIGVVLEAQSLFQGKSTRIKDDQF